MSHKPPARRAWPVPLNGPLWDTRLARVTGPEVHLSASHAAPMQSDDRRPGRNDATEMARMISTHPVGSSERRVVGLNWVQTGIAVCCILACFVFAWGFLSRPPNGPANFAEVLPPLCLVAALMGLLGQSRIVVDGAGFIDMVGPLFVRRVPVEDVLAIETREGVVLRLVSGRRIGTVAYQWGRGTGPHHPIFIKFAGRLERAIGGLPDTALPAATRPDGVLTRPKLERAVERSRGDDCAGVRHGDSQHPADRYHPLTVDSRRRP